MGSQIGGFVEREEMSLKELGNIRDTDLTAAVDTYTWLYAFLHKIVDYKTHKPLKDSEGRITSHLSGLYYRTMNIRAAGIDPVFVFEGGYPDLKEDEIESRNKSKEKAQREYEIARAIGNDERAKELETSRRKISDEMVATAYDLIEAMGCPIIEPPEEAEAQCAKLCEDGQVDFVISSDYDTLLHGSPNLIQNLNSTSGDLILLDKSLDKSDLNYREFVWIGIMMGTDFNKSPHGVGEKTSYDIAKSSNSIGEVVNQCKEYDGNIDGEIWRSTFEILTQPNVDLDIDFEKWKMPNKDSIIEILVEKHEFSEQKVLSSYQNVEEKIGTSTFDEFM